MTDFICFGRPSELFISNLDTSEEVKLIKYEEPVTSWVYNDLSTLKISKVKMDVNSFPHYQLYSTIHTFFTISSYKKMWLKHFIHIKEELIVFYHCVKKKSKWERCIHVCKKSGKFRYA